MNKFLQITINTQKDVYKIFYGYLLILLVSASPILIAGIAKFIADRIGCTLNEASAGDCKVYGIQIGGVLSTLFNMFWLAFITLPLGIGLTIQWTINVFKAIKAYNKKSES